MATLATQVVNYQGLTPAYTAAAGGGDNFVPDQDTFIVVKNGGGSPMTVTIARPGTETGGLATPDVGPISVPNASEKWLGPFPAEWFADNAGTPAGNAFMTYSAVTTVTVGVIKVPRQ